MAPEVLQKGAMAMPADVYSFAMLMLELWTGEIVYSGINSHQVGSLPDSLDLEPGAMALPLAGVIAPDIHAFITMEIALTGSLHRTTGVYLCTERGEALQSIHVVREPA